MALEDIDLPRQGTHGHTPGERLQAALAWAVSGTSKAASDLCGIPASTIRDWAQQEYWPALVAEARQLKNDELDGKLTNILDLCTELLTKRLRAALDDPDVARGIRDAAIVAGIAHDKRALLRGDPTSRTERVSANDRLAKLKDEFAGLMQARADKAAVKTQH